MRIVSTSNKSLQIQHNFNCIFSLNKLVDFLFTFYVFIYNLAGICTRIFAYLVLNSVTSDLNLSKQLVERIATEKLYYINRIS